MGLPEEEPVEVEVGVPLPVRVPLLKLDAVALAVLGGVPVGGGDCEAVGVGRKVVVEVALLAGLLVALLALEGVALAVLNEVGVGKNWDEAH